MTVRPCDQPMGQIGRDGHDLRLMRGGRVVLTITNTLPTDRPTAEDAPRGHGIAQANVRDRLRLLHDVDCDFSAGVQGGLYQVRISLPAP